MNVKENLLLTNLTTASLHFPIKRFRKRNCRCRDVTIDTLETELTDLFLYQLSSNLGYLVFQTRK